MAKKRKDEWYCTFSMREYDNRRHLWQQRDRALENADYDEAMELQEQLDYHHEDGSDVYPGDAMVEAVWEGKF